MHRDRRENDQQRGEKRDEAAETERPEDDPEGKGEGSDSAEDHAPILAERRAELPDEFSDGAGRVIAGCDRFLNGAHEATANDHAVGTGS